VSVREVLGGDPILFDRFLKDYSESFGAATGKA
jgi:hypothetical protein